MYGMNFHINTAALSLSTFLDTVDRNFFTPKFGTYEHMTFFNDHTAFKMLVIGLYIGLVIASLFMFYNKRVLGGFVRKLDAEGALCKENAKTLAELDYAKNPFIKLSLKTGYSLRRVVSYVPVFSEESSEGKSPSDKKIEKKLAKKRDRVGGNLANAAYLREKIDFAEDKFYLPEEKRDRAIQRFRAKDSGFLSVLLFALIGLIAVVIIFKLAPFVVGIIESLVEGMSGESEVLN